MKPSTHSYEDKLLELAYGELPPHEAKALEAHVQGCGRCTEALSSIRGVRQAMGKLPEEPAPEAGLDSLLAYAEQAARRAAAGPAPKPVWWRRWLVPLAGASALAVLVVVGVQVNESVDLEPKPAAKEAAAPPPAQASSEEVWANAPQPAPEPSAAPEAKEDNALRRQLKVASKLATRERSSKGAEPTPPAPDEAPVARAEKARAPKKDVARDAESERGGVGGLMANFGERAADPRDALGDDYGAGRASSQVAQAPAPARPAPSLGLNVGSSSELRGGSVPSGSTGFSSAPTSRAAEPAPAKRSLSFDKREEAQGYAPADEARQAAADHKALLSQAHAAHAAGDRQREAAIAQQVLDNGATGYQRAEALKRLCDVYLDLGEEGRADRYCRALLREFPSTGAAKMVQQRLERPKLRKKAAPSQADFEEDLAKPAEPAESKPAY